ncbi:MAG: NAD(+)/NADH kinase [Acidimicrobiales bacterium]
MATIGVIPHPGRPSAVRLAEATADWLIGQGHQARILLDEAATAGTSADLDPHRRQRAIGLDLAVSLGGDGTMLRVVDLVLPLGIPVLGVNVGHLGFLTEVTPEELPQALARFLVGEYRIEERMTLAVETRLSTGGDPRIMTALNDVVLQRTTAGHTVRLAVSLSGTPFLVYTADSMIVATPTGSTAYNLSARGPIASPGTRVLLLTPVAAHMLFDRSLVLAEDEDITFEVVGDLRVELVVDGQGVGCLGTGDVVHCRAGDHFARFVEFGGRDFHHVLKRKFGSPER